MCSLELKPTFTSESFPGPGKYPKIMNSSRLGKSPNPHSLGSLLWTRNLLHFLWNEEERLKAPLPDQMSPFPYSAHFHIDTGKEAVTGSQPCRLWSHHRLPLWTQPGKHACTQPQIHFWLYSFFKGSQINLTWGFSGDVLCSCCCKAQSVPIATWERHQNYNRMNDTFL